TESFIVGHVGRARHEVNDAVRDTVRFGRCATPKMFEATADPSEACRKPIAQHVTASSASLAIEEKHSQGTEYARAQTHPDGTYHGRVLRPLLAQMRQNACHGTLHAARTAGVK